MFKRLKLLQEWEHDNKTYRVGTILDVDLTTADELIKGATAEEYKEPEPVTVTQEGVTLTAEEVQKQVQAEIKNLIGDIKPPIPRVGGIKERIEDDPKRGFKHFGEFLHTLYDASTPGKDMDRRLKFCVEEKAPTGLGVGVDSDGGFLVPEGFAANLMQKTNEQGQMLSRATRIPMTQGYTVRIPFINETSRATGSRSGGIQVYRRAEAAVATASRPTFGQVKLELNKLMGLCWDTEELLKWSAISMEPLLTSLFASEFAFTIQNELVRGTGVAQALGILNCPALVSQAAEAGQPPATIVSENITNMWSRMYAPSRASAVWFINQDVEPQLDMLNMAVGTGGMPTYMPPGGLADAPYGRLKGRPIIPIEQCATLGTVGDIILADMSQYLYAEDSSGIQAATSIHVNFTRGETVMRWTMYNDGQPWWNSPLTPFQGGAGNTVSPFVVLATRA